MGEPRRRRGPEQRPHPGAAEALGCLACSRGGQAVGTSRGGGRAGNCREGHTGKVPLDRQKGAGARRWDTRGEMAQAPTEVVLEAGFPLTSIGGGGTQPRPLPTPHPVRGGPQNSGAQVAPRPGVSSCLCPMKKEIPPPSCPRPAHHPLPAQMPIPLTPWSHTGTGTPSAQEPGSGVKGDALQPAAPKLRRWAGARAPSEGTEPSIPQGPCVPSPSPPTA